MVECALQFVFIKADDHLLHVGRNFDLRLFCNISPVGEVAFESRVYAVRNTS